MSDSLDIGHDQRRESVRRKMKAVLARHPEIRDKSLWDRLIETRDRHYEVERMYTLAARGFFDG